MSRGNQRFLLTNLQAQIWGVTIGKEEINGKMAELEVMDEEPEALLPLITGEFPVLEFGLREKKKMELNKEHFIEKLVKKKN
jgi:hypothetical protein